MKKIIVSTLLCLVVASSAMAQGRINFANSSATAVRISANADGSASVILGSASTAAFGIGPASARIQLFASANSATLAANSYSEFVALSLSPVLIGTGANLQSVTNSANGTLAASQGTFPGGSTLVIPGNNGTPLFLRFTASSINGLYAGLSTIIQVTPTLSPAAAALTFNTVAGPSAWNGVTMVPVPEPSSMALAGLGAASLLIFRRRK